MKKTIPFLVAITVAIGVFVYILVTVLFRASRPVQRLSMPAVVEEPMEAILQSLETELNTHNSAVIASLYPGISDEELRQAEASLGRSIHPEMKALYRWHNGLANDMELFPGHGFLPLGLAIQTNRELTEQYRDKGFSLLMAHEKHWLILFPDSAGDGYYYDPVKDYETGGVFYNFREAGYYRYFPSIKNLLKALVECYRQGAYLPKGETNFEVEERILNNYGIAVQE
jgi:hypothetical protein